MNQAHNIGVLTVCFEHNGKRSWLKIMPEDDFHKDTWFCCDDTFTNLQESVGFAFGSSPENAIVNYFENIELAGDPRFNECDDVLAHVRHLRKKRKRPLNPE